MESRRFVASVELVEKAIEANQPFVGILRGEVHAVVVIPERTERLVDIPIGLVVGVKSGQNVGIILVAEMPIGVEVARITVAFGRIVRVVQVSGNRWKTEACVVLLRDLRQRVDIASELRGAVEGAVRWSRTAGTCAVVESPDGLRR